MERRRAEIIQHLNSIIEKKDSLVTNLNSVVKEIENAVEIMNIANPDELKRSKHLLNVVKYELTFMRLLSEMAYSFDCFLEEEEPPVINHMRSSYSRTSSVCEEHVHNGVDITTLKEQFQQLNEKIQTSCPAVLEYVTDFYSNTSGSSRNNSCSQTLTNGNSNLNGNICLTSGNFVSSYEVPEKDLGRCGNVNASQPANGTDHTFGMNSNSRYQVPINPVLHNGFPVETNLNSNYQIPVDVPLQKTLSADTKTEQSNDGPPLIDLSNPTACSSKTTPKVVIENCNFKSIEQSEKEKSSEKKVLENHVPAGDSSESDPEIIEIMDKSAHIENASSEGMSTQSGTSSSSNGSVIYTAVDKLNNLKILDRREEALKKYNPIHVPDLSLKPLIPERSPVVVKNHLQSKTEHKHNAKRYDSEILEDVDLEECDLPVVGQECVFSHIESPSEFYLHLVNDFITSIDKISEDIAEFYDDSAPTFRTKTEAKARTKKYCVAYVIDSWYRVEILDWLMENTARDDDVLVHLVDFGDRHKVPYTALRHMPAKVASIPKLATRCHLVCLYPPESTVANLSTKWPSASIEALANLSGIYSKESCRFFRVTYVDKVDGSVAIDLSNSSDDDSVGQILMDLNLAVQIIDPELVEEDENLDTFLRDANDLVEADDIVEAIQGYSAKDESRICKFSRRGKTCYKGAKCPYEHIEVKDGFTTDKVYVHMDALSKIHLPDVGSKVTILITGFIDICQFYVHIVRDPIHINNHLVDKSLYNLIELMNNIDLTKIYTPFKIWPAVGEIVAVKHWATKKWLRGKIRHLIMDEDGASKGAQVFIVDFGEVVDVPLTSVRQINEDFLHLPFQAVECYLHDVQQRHGVDKNEAHNFFLENMSFRNFQATIMSTTEPLRLSINTFKNFNISSTLLKLKLAEPRTTDSHPAEESRVQPE